MHSWISHAEQDVNQLCGFHCQKWLHVNMPANFVLKFQATGEKMQKNLRGILFAAPVCYTNSSLALTGIYTYISLRFTQSNSPTRTKSLLSFRNTRISRISRQSVSASTHRENTFHLGLWCRCSYKFFGQCGNQWMDYLLQKVMASFFDRYAQSLCRYWSVWISNFPLWRKC